MSQCLLNHRQQLIAITNHLEGGRDITELSLVDVAAGFVENLIKSSKIALVNRLGKNRRNRFPIKTVDLLAMINQERGDFAKNINQLVLSENRDQHIHMILTEIQRLGAVVQILADRRTAVLQDLIILSVLSLISLQSNKELIISIKDVINHNALQLRTNIIGKGSLEGERRGVVEDFIINSVKGVNINISLNVTMSVTNELDECVGVADLADGNGFEILKDCIHILT